MLCPSPSQWLYVSRVNVATEHQQRSSALASALPVSDLRFWPLDIRPQAAMLESVPTLSARFAYFALHSRIAYWA